MKKIKVFVAFTFVWYVIMYLLFKDSGMSLVFSLPLGFFSMFGEPQTKHKPLSKMTGLEFEHYCAKWLMQTGKYVRAETTKASGDFGGDVIAYDRKGRKWVFQCKLYKKKVPNGAVQEVVAAKAHYKAEKGGVITNSKLTKAARQLAMENDIELFEMLSD